MVGDRRVVVLVDTTAENWTTGALSDVSKFTVMPHLPAVVAGRGALDCLPRLFNEVMVRGSTFEEIVEALPAWAEKALHEVNDSAHEAGMGARESEGQEFAIVGWSAMRGQLEAHMVRC